MIRPFPTICFLGAAIAGAWLYQVKHQVSTYDRELREIRRQTEQARDRTAILRAEWALLNEPDRLRQVATRHLPLEPMQPQHFTRLAEMERRLPAAVAFAGAPNILAPLDPPRGAAPTMLAAAQVPAPATPLASAAGRTAPGSTAPAATAARTPPDPRAPEAPAPQALAAAVAEQRAGRPANPLPAMPARPAPLRDAPRPEPAVARTAPPAPQPAPAPPPQPVRSRPAPAAEPPVMTARAPSPPANVASAQVTSALGISTSSLGRPMLAPPVPFSAAQAATPAGSGR